MTYLNLLYCKWDKKSDFQFPRRMAAPSDGSTTSSDGAAIRRGGRAYQRITFLSRAEYFLKLSVVYNFLQQII